MIGNNTTISVQRLAIASGKETYATAHVSNAPCYIERANPELAQFFDGSGAYEVYVCISDTVLDVLETDRVTDRSGEIYTVRGLRSYTDNLDVPNHTEIILYKAYDKA